MNGPDWYASLRPVVEGDQAVAANRKPDEWEMAMGAKLAQLRRKAGLSQEGLARKAGVGTDAVRKWERGKRTPSVRMLIKLAKTLNVTVNDLVVDDPPPPKPARKPKKGK
jgi:DNA-binding XRE family transcriptional regulator